MVTFELQTLESDLQRALDEIYSLLEKIKINNRAFHNRGLVEHGLDSISISLQSLDMKYKNDSEVQILISKSVYLMQVWFRIVVETNYNDHMEHILMNNMMKLQALCNEYLKTKDSRLLDFIDDFQTSIDELKKLAQENKLDNNNILRLFIVDSITSSIDNYTLHQNKAYITSDFGNIKAKLLTQALKKNEWDIEIRIKDKDLSKELLLLSTIAKILEYDGKNIVELEEIKKGSLLSKLKTKFTNIWNKKETKEIINMAKEEVLAHASKQTKTNDKTDAETEKTKAETEQLKKELEAQSKEELKEMKSLELRKLKAEVLGSELDNELKKIEVFERYSQLLANGILSVEEFELKIEGQTVIKKLGNDISGENISDNDANLSA